MIVKIDHIAISSAKFEEHIELICSSLGYIREFVEKDIPNLKIKKSFLSIFGKLHDMSLLSSSGNVNIEFINHRYLHNKKAFITPIFENVPQNLINTIGKKKIKDFTVDKVIIKDLDIPVYVQDSDNGTFAFNKIVIEVKDIGKSTKFWKLLGFKPLKLNRNFALLEFKSFFTEGVFQIYLEHSDNAPADHFLDDKGFNCVALISTSINKKKEMLDKNGFKTTSLEKFMVNQKHLNIFFSQGHCGELVEIIGIDK